MTATIKAEPCRGKDLKPGDLFSTAGPGYWDHFAELPGVGQRVYIRTNSPVLSGDGDEPVYRITIIKEDAGEEPSETVQ